MNLTMTWGIHMQLDDYEEYQFSKSKHFGQKLADNAGCIAFIGIIFAFAALSWLCDLLGIV